MWTLWNGATVVKLLLVSTIYLPYIEAGGAAGIVMNNGFIVGHGFDYDVPGYPSTNKEGSLQAWDRGIWCPENEGMAVKSFSWGAKEYTSDMTLVEGGLMSFDYAIATALGDWDYDYVLRDYDYFGSASFATVYLDLNNLRFGNNMYQVGQIMNNGLFNYQWNFDYDGEGYGKTYAKVYDGDILFSYYFENLKCWTNGGCANTVNQTAYWEAIVWLKDENDEIPKSVKKNKKTGGWKIEFETGAWMDVVGHKWARYDAATNFAFLDEDTALEDVWLDEDDDMVHFLVPIVMLDEDDVMRQDGYQKFDIPAPLGDYSLPNDRRAARAPQREYFTEFAAWVHFPECKNFKKMTGRKAGNGSNRGVMGVMAMLAVLALGNL